MSNPLVSTDGVATMPLQAAGNPVGAGASPQVSGAFVIDGTPIRVVTLGVAAALTVLALRWAGFKFNVGVSS